jgi:hypothetical protein|tara:strand:+ start:1254 stop:1430 length:177 start_codon:yes stop_codon:yes gene_type:complete
MKDKDRVEAHLVAMDAVMKERKSLKIRKDNKLSLRAFKRIVARSETLLEENKFLKNKL